MMSQFNRYKNNNLYKNNNKLLKIWSKIYLLINKLQIIKFKILIKLVKNRRLA